MARILLTWDSTLEQVQPLPSHLSDQEVEEDGAEPEGESQTEVEVPELGSGEDHQLRPAVVRLLLSLAVVPVDPLVEGLHGEGGGGEAGCEVHEVLGLVVVADADVEPGAVVVHLEDTSPAGLTVVAARCWEAVSDQRGESLTLPCRHLHFLQVVSSSRAFSLNSAQDCRVSTFVSLAPLEREVAGSVTDDTEQFERHEDSHSCQSIWSVIQHF